MIRLLRWLGANWGHLLLQLLGRLTSITVKGDTTGMQFLAEERSCLLSIWHGKMLLPLYQLRRRGIWMIVSQHRDGVILASVIQKLGYHCVRGSSTRGGKEAREVLQTQLKDQGITALINPDGPTGPRQQLKPGVVVIAQRSGVPILPVTFTATRSREFNSWDRFMVWLPGSRSTLLVGAPISIGEEMSVEDGIELVQDRMMQLENRCDQLN